MALPVTHTGLSPSETAFLCEMELVTVIPRERLDSIPLIGGSTPALRPPQRSNLPLWLALLLKRQRRCSIVPPPWLSTASLTTTLEREISGRSGSAQNGSSTSLQSPHHNFSSPPPQSQSQQQGQQAYQQNLPPFIATTPLERNPTAATPPFQQTSIAHSANSSGTTQPTLPYHWLSLSHLLLTYASDDIPDSAQLTRLLRDLREVRQAKVRGIVGRVTAGAGVDVSGIGAVELGEARGFLCGVANGLRKLGASREGARREEWVEGGGGEGRGRRLDEDEDEDMEM